MASTEHSIIGYWPALKTDLTRLISDTDAWVIAEIKKAYENKDWDRIGKVIEVMDLIHDLSHGH